MKKIRNRISDLKLNIKFTALIVCIVMIPVGILLSVLVYNMEQTTKGENLAYMDYALERNQNQLSTCVDSVNMVTQFFLSDSGILELLNASVSGKEYSPAELLTYYENDIAALERLVSNNPLLYGVRVYAVNDNVQEMMPILYNHSRMEQMSWVTKDQTHMRGWHFNYYDALFSTVASNQDGPLAAYVTPIRDYHNGLIGYIEVVMKMDTIFPQLYSEKEGEWGCLISEDGERIYGSNGAKEHDALFTDMLNEVKDTSQESSFYITRRGGQHWAASYLPVKEFNGGMLLVRDASADQRNLNPTPAGIVVIMILVMILLGYFTNLIVKHLLRHLYDILKTIRHVQNGKLNERIEVLTHDEMGELGMQLNRMLDRIQELMQENFDRELLAKNSQIRALQNQINAHFIYNVLESIKMMAEIDEEYTISDAVTSLGILLRYSMRWVNGNVLVREELEYIRNYVSLLNLRFDYEIILSVNIPEELLNQEIPKMSLQPIVENSIRHGIEDMAEDTTIYIKAVTEGNDCIIEVTDSGKGMSQDQVEQLEKRIAGKLEAAGGDGHGIGLKNVQDRINIAFGPGYGLTVRSKEGCYTKVGIRLPKRCRMGVSSFVKPGNETTQEGLKET